jgi:hypothetical protein
MRRWAALLVVVILGVVSGPAGAANWRFVASGPGGNSWVDTTTLVRQGDCVTFWHRLTFKHTPGGDRPLYHQLRIRTRICCRARTLQELEYVALDRELEEKSRWRPMSEAQPVRRGTVAEALLQFVCPRAR